MMREDLIVWKADLMGHPYGEAKVYVKEDADKVVDAMESRIKELEDKLQHLRDCRWEQIKALSFDHIDHSRRLHKIIKHVRQRYGSLLSKFLETKTCLKVKKERIKELESQLPKWISVNDRLPTEDGEYQVVYKHKNGAMVSTFDEWDNDYKGWCAAETSAVAYWAELLPPPPTEKENG